MKLQMQMNSKFKEADTSIKSGKSVIMITPPLDEDYWLFRVPLSDKQAIVGFPKFGTIGIGFQHEDYDWNTNFPYQCDALEIFNHIKDNKGDETIPDEDCIKAIQMIQLQARLLMKKESNK